MVSVSDGETSWAGHPTEFNWDKVHGRTLLAHNAGFDSEVFAEMKRRKLIPASVVPKEWICTANLSTYLCNRRALADASLKLFNDRVDKSARSDANNLHWPDFTPDQKKVMLEYARKDAWRCHRIWAEHGHRWPQVERDLSSLTIEQGRKGVHIDVELLNRYIVELFEMLNNTEELIPWVKDADDEDNDEPSGKPTSTKAAMETCRRAGIPCPPLRKYEDDYAKWEKIYAPKHPWILALSSWRSVNKAYKQMLLIKERLVYGEGFPVMPFALKYFGAHTGRWSGDGKFNVQNPRKEPIFCNEKGLMETDEQRIFLAMRQHDEEGTWPEWVRSAIDIRKLIVARPGHKLVISDLAQIEPRVLAWLVKDTNKLKLVSEGMSPYEAHARQSMGWTGGNLKKEDKGKYALAKARELGLGYQCGWEKFIGMAKTLAGLDITVNDPKTMIVEHPITGDECIVSGYGKFSKETVADFRARNPKIVNMWKSLDEAFKASVGHDFTMVLPSGRKMTYEDVRAEMKIVVDKETGKPKKQVVYTAYVGGKRKGFYGGKLTENITQATARDVFGVQLVDMTKQQIRCLFTAHDEAVTEVSLDYPEQEIVQIMSQTPAWLKGCPIAAEAQTSHHYMK
jgi:DNA polymerase